jgi:NhaA family Na+:H+ antiporter
MGGIVLLACTAAALILANSPWASSYAALWHTTMSFRLAGFNLSHDLHFWVDDLLMAVFFFLVGLEIKRELLAGELASPRQAALPILAALGGVLVPALLYTALNAGSPGARGWGIPMATDIAFALGALAILGNRIPPALKVFVAALAIVDDLAAVIVIALFYTPSLNTGAIVCAMACLLALLILNRRGASKPLPYILVGLLLWLAVLASGIHSTIAGVLLAFTIPYRENRQATARKKACENTQSPLQLMEHKLQPWVAFGIMPLFAMANAGVPLPADPGRAFADFITLGVMLGLVLGKPLGITLASWLAVRFGWASLPGGVSLKQIHGTGWLAGIGFTMSFFMAGLSFADNASLTAAKLGILAASLCSAFAGCTILTLTTRRGVAP